jgi:hypothetical protein
MLSTYSYPASGEEIYGASAYFGETIGFLLDKGVNTYNWTVV